MNISVETTSDGSPTLYRKDIDEHYHSVKGALSESLHVYIDLGWKNVADRKEYITVFEVGYGTGLNAALTAHAAAVEGVRTNYVAVELFPVSKEITDLLIQHLPEEYRESFRKVNEAQWDIAVEINQFFTLTKIKGDLLNMKMPTSPDVVYFDAFAPEKQPEMWNEALFTKLFDSMNPGACLTTYCAKGVIRRMLSEIGFITERLPGPPGGKREVLRATKP